jgi:hypothetical protein
MFSVEASYIDSQIQKRGSADATVNLGDNVRRSSRLLSVTAKGATSPLQDSHEGHQILLLLCIQIKLQDKVEEFNRVFQS